MQERARIAGGGEPIETMLENEEQHRARQNRVVARTDLEP